MSDFAPVHVTYTLSVAQKRSATQIAGRSSSVWFLVSMSLQLPLAPIRLSHHAEQSVMLAIDITLLCLLAGLIVAGFFLVGGASNWATRGDLTIDGNGLRGTLDGDALNLPWRAVASVNDRDGLWIIER